jgi:hypothetical protein
MPDGYATRFAMAILLSMVGLTVGLIFHTSPAALLFALLIAVGAWVICPPPL